MLPTTADEFRTPVNEEAKALALALAEAADDRKAGDITILQTGDISYLADYFVIVTGFSNVQVRAIANSIESTAEDKFERQSLRTEGMSEGRWVLKDYGDVIVHIFMPTDREFYDLEAFWGHAERIEFAPTSLNS
ncbi:MAG: ribosome silencing factor [Cyanobacteria bacterium J06576_12]